MRPLKVVGFDPSLNNWGVAQGTLYDDNLCIDYLSVTQPVLSKGKQVRQNSLDLEAAEQLAHVVLKTSRGADVIFAEVPVGSQSARAMASYGICVGILGSLRALGIPFFEVTATEVKLAMTGCKTATKAQMITAAERRHQGANWPRFQRDGQSFITESKAEHMADAIGAIYAGIQLASFKQLMALNNTMRLQPSPTPN